MPPPIPEWDSGWRDSDAGTPRERDGGQPDVSAEAIATGTGELIAVFTTEAGIVVVDPSAVRLIDRAGTEWARFSPGREITAAAFDGTYLGVADRAKLTTLEPDLTELTTVLLTEWCSSAAIVSGHRFVCGPSNDWDRVYYTYDMVDGVELARSSEYTYNGMWMRRIPGTDHFLTVSGGSPSDLHLYQTLPTHVVEYINESPYHGDFSVDTVLAFIGNPATHVVTHGGLLLEIFTDDCVTGSSFTSGCFTRDGDLGSIPTGARYAAMTEDDAGHVYGIVDTSDRWFGDAYCETGCTVHQVDASARTIVTSTSYSGTFLEPVALKYDAVSEKLVFGAHTMGDRFDGYTRYEIRLLPFR